uniref:Uncharacterized protein n=1 Tax=Oryza brachyantha TaxID=4533 RepID=J3KTX9_ORYBR
MDKYLKRKAPDSATMGNSSLEPEDHSWEKEIEFDPNTLSLALQRKDQHIVNAVKCVRSTRGHLDELRRDGWEKLEADVYTFCDKYDIIKLEMEEVYINPKRPRQKTGITNKHHYEVDCFNDVIDWLLEELDNRFNETTSELLVCSAAFNPIESFHDFNVESLMNLAKFYPNDFSSGELIDLSHHLSLYIADVREDDKFSQIETISELSQKMVETRKHVCYPLVYRLLKLVLLTNDNNELIGFCYYITSVSIFAHYSVPFVTWWKNKEDKTTLTEKETRRETLWKILLYFPIKQRLPMLFMYKESTDEGRAKDDVSCHPVLRKSTIDEDINAIDTSITPQVQLHGAITHAHARNSTIRTGALVAGVAHRKIAAAIGGGVSVAKAQRSWTAVVEP